MFDRKRWWPALFGHPSHAHLPGEPPPRLQPRAYALILLSPDDIGGPKGCPPERLHGRARQNVILELGLFVGKLGRSRVGVLYKPGVELPSDISGVVYIAYESIDAARLAIIKELKAAGLPLNMARLLGH